MGVAYLFHTNGTPLATFQEPAPVIHSYFGFVVAALGSDRVIIGTFSSNYGAAYLFSTNGTLLTAFTNPVASPSARTSRFGWSLTAVGPDKVLIGSTDSYYLFSTNGTIVTIVTNSMGGIYRLLPLASLGPDRMVIGTSLYSTNGMLLTTFTNPYPGSGLDFGSAVAGFGMDKILIGAKDYTVAVSNGMAHLFDTNGALLRTFTNPAPGVYRFFGSSVAAVGENKILIGSPGSGTVIDPAFPAAYLFHTNGTLLATLTNSPPTTSSQFGTAVAALDSNHVLIGLNHTAVLYSLSGTSPRRLQLVRLGANNVRFSWPLSAQNFVLEQNADLSDAAAWSQVPFPYETNVTDISITVAPSENTFYRLRDP